MGEGTKRLGWRTRGFAFARCAVATVRLRRPVPIRWHLLAFAILILLPQLALGIAFGSWYAASERRRVEDTAVAAAPPCEASSTVSWRP